MSSVMNNGGDNYNAVQKFTIEGVTYNIQTYWNVRSGWYLGIYDVDNNPLALGLKLMPNAFVSKYSLDNYYKGELLCVDTSPERDENGLPVEGLTIDNFGIDRRYQLVYLTEQDLIDFEDE